MLITTPGSEVSGSSEIDASCIISNALGEVMGAEDSALMLAMWAGQTLYAQDLHEDSRCMHQAHDGSDQLADQWITTFSRQPGV